MIERMTLVLDAFDAGSPRLTLVEIVERTGLARSTAHRILDQLVTLRWLEHTAGSYGLGMRLLELGGLAVANNALREVTSPLLYDLHQRTGAVCTLAVLDRRDVVYVDLVGSGPAARLVTRVGGRAPAHATAAGKAMLAWAEPATLAATYRERLPSRTPRTITSLELLRQDLAQVRARGGIAYDREECVQGVASVAAALRGPGRALAALELSGLARVVRLERLGPLVAEAAREAGRALFPPPGRRKSRALPAPSAWPPGALDRLVQGIGGDYWL